MRLSPKLIYDEISKTVIGQEEAKKAVSTALFLHVVRFFQSMEMPETTYTKSNILLMGPTGCGKTFIIREGCKAIRKLTTYDICPLLEVDCTEVSARGWEGEDLSSLIGVHYMKHRENEAVFNTSVVFLDEFDKLCKPAVGKGGTDHNRQTQYGFLKLIEGCIARDKSGRAFNTDKLLFVLSGNFSEIRQARINRTKPLGFTAKEKKYKVDYHLELEEAGMVTQLVGRVPHVAEIQQLDNKDLRKILDKNLIPQLRDTWKYLGQNFHVPTSLKKKIVNNCVERKTGARGLNVELCKYSENKLFNVEFKK